MSSTPSRPSSTSATTNPGRSTPPSRRWRTVDIVVAAVLAVAFGVVFVAWNALWSLTGPFFFPPAQAILYGVWLLPGVLGGYLIRKPGAALFTELVAAFVSSIPGGPWNGGQIVLWGLLEGLAPELVFLALRYRVDRKVVLVLGAIAAALVPAVLDNVYFYPTWVAGWQLTYGALVVVSTLVIAALGSILLVRALARTGVLAPFAAGRDQVQV